MAVTRNRAVSFLVATFLLAAALTLAQENKSPVATIVPPGKFDAPKTTPHATTHAPTNTTIHTTTTATPNTTTTHATTTTNTTTPAHTNTTTTHATTTTNTTTHAPTNTTTTHATTTTNTTTPAPTTTPLPGPTKSTTLTLGNYNISDGSLLCIVLKAAIQIHVNNSQGNGTFIVQPSMTTSYGQCQNDKTGKLGLSFNEGVIVLNFVKNETTKTVYANSVAVNLTYAFTSGVRTTISNVNGSTQVFTMSASHSYSCKSEMVYMGNGVNLEFSQERLQAFDFGKDGQFGPIDLCKADQPNYSVAIAVGIVLIVLIVIVVIAYLISRRKRTDGYQTL
ncbi:macrosialin-like [Astyanax mexicanus]|uniref:CD68 molecule n=1 Tax=Astyanax mexicanus TaxID=7994 RepID=A0A8B9KXT1_ASTMX|nr:macrosialin-like [Astyanax mexicanus]